MLNKIKFFFKKIRMTESRYNELIYKENCYNNAMKYIDVDVKTETVDVKSGKDNYTICRYEASRQATVNIKLFDILKALGLEFSKGVEINIIK